MKKILGCFLGAVVAFGADAPQQDSPQNQATNATPNNATSATAATQNANAQGNLAATVANADERLKDEIITFDRVNYLKSNTEIGDPFIYVYPQSEQDLARILKTEQAVLVLNGIFEDRASINNAWVGKQDVIEGWTVSDVKKDRVELKFRDRTKTLYVFTNNENIKIK